MDLRYSTFRLSSSSSIYPLYSSKFRRSRSRSSNFFKIRSSLPFSPQKAKYYRELEAAVDVVHRACHICVEVQKSLFSDDRRILEKTDNSPVTIADFSVQALISLELGKLFPLIPLVAEEDSAFLQANNLADAVVQIVNDKTNFTHENLTEDEVLEAIDRGGQNAVAFEAKPATYWVLDPIDGTRGFLKGGSSLYVVGLALVVEGEIVLGVMGCPKWPDNFSNQNSIHVQESQKLEPKSGIIMASHVGCGVWLTRLSTLVSGMSLGSLWERCFVNGCSVVSEAHFCIPNNRTWDSIPLSDSFSATTNAASVGDTQILLLPSCCGSLCKYLMVASGRASVYILQARAQIRIKAWDHAAGMICVHEAGGKVTDWKGSELDLSVDEIERRVIFPSGGVLATNGNLHSQILELISSNSSVVS